MERAAIEACALDITVPGRIAVGADDEPVGTVGRVITLVEPDRHLVEDRRGDLVYGAGSGRAPRTEQPDRHQCAHAAHLPLVFVVPAIPPVGRDGPVSLFVHPANPVLREPGFPAPAEYVCIGASGLVGVADVALSVAEHEILRCGLLECIIELFAEFVITAHERCEGR